MTEWFKIKDKEGPCKNLIIPPVTTEVLDIILHAERAWLSEDNKQLKCQLPGGKEKIIENPFPPEI